jgi:hypothetical protein
VDALLPGIVVEKAHHADARGRLDVLGSSMLPCRR